MRKRTTSQFNLNRITFVETIHIVERNLSTRVYGMLVEFTSGRDAGHEAADIYV